MAAEYLLRLPSIRFGQNVIVVEASVLAVALGDDGAVDQRARERLADETLVAPEFVDLEVVVAARRAAGALADLADLPIRRASHQPFLHRIWQLRNHVTPYDAAYIALAEALDLTLVTADARLSRASGVRCEVEAIGRVGRG